MNVGVEGGGGIDIFLCLVLRSKLVDTAIQLRWAEVA